MPTTVKNAKHFSSIASGYDFMDSIMNNNSWFLRHIPNSRRNLLDVGCGSGIMLEALSPHFENAVGIDLSESMLHIARNKRALPNITYIQSDACTFQATASFDYIVSRTTLHHINDVPALLERLRNMTTPGGRIAILDCFSNRQTPTRFRNTVMGVVNSIFDAFRFGPVTAAKVMKFRLSKDWLDHLDTDCYLSSRAFQDVLSAALPGCRFEYETCFIGAVWDSPVE